MGAPATQLGRIWWNYNEPHLIVKEDKYADYYDRHLPAPGAPIRMLELGVQSGGSVRAWRQYYSSNLYYVGVDINPLCNRSHSPGENLHIEIGSQHSGSMSVDFILVEPAGDAVPAREHATSGVLWVALWVARGGRARRSKVAKQTGMRRVRAGGACAANSSAFTRYSILP